MRRIHRATFAAIAALAALAIACAEAAGPQGPGGTAMCVGAVQVNGINYVWLSNDSGLSEGSEPDRIHATVLSYMGCTDVVTLPNPDPHDNILDDGESNFLPVGTDLYVVPGHPPTERLAAWFEARWIVLIAQ